MTEVLPEADLSLPSGNRPSRVETGPPPGPLGATGLRRLRSSQSHAGLPGGDQSGHFMTDPNTTVMAPGFEPLTVLISNLIDD